MAVENCLVALQVWRYEGGPPTDAEFLGNLKIDVADPVVVRKVENPRVDLLSIEQSEFVEAEEPSEAFVKEFEHRLNQSADWLNRQTVDVFHNLRESGFSTAILFNAWIDCDQLDLELPAKFLQACGRLGLNIEIITND